MKSKTHRISIPSILEIGPNVLENTGKILFEEGFKDVLICTDEFIYNTIKDVLENSLNEYNIKYTVKLLDPDFQIEELTTFALSMSGDIDVVLGVGGGSVLDKAKFASFIRKKVYISMTTSPSNDGFSSPVASLYVKNKRTTVPAKIPYGVLADTKIISNVPDHMIYSGIGDSVSNYTALFDLYYEKERREINLDKFSALISKRSIDTLISLNFSGIRSEEFINSLMETLMMSGISMEIAGTSSPASGSEHLISHAIDKILEKNNYPHGVQVGIATYIICLVQENEKTNAVDEFLEKTGFWEYVKSLSIKASVFIDAIDVAPSIKEYRKTIIHSEDMRIKAKSIIKDDIRLQDVLVHE